MLSRHTRPGPRIGEGERMMRKGGGGGGVSPAKKRGLPQACWMSPGSAPKFACMFGAVTPVSTWLLKSCRVMREFDSSKSIYVVTNHKHHVLVCTQLLMQQPKPAPAGILAKVHTSSISTNATKNKLFKQQQQRSHSSRNSHAVSQRPIRIGTCIGVQRSRLSCSYASECVLQDWTRALLPLLPANKH